MGRDKSAPITGMLGYRVLILLGRGWWHSDVEMMLRFLMEMKGAVLANQARNGHKK